MIKLYEVPFSTNVERVQLALAHKGLACEHIVSSYDDRSLVARVSGQGLVPVLDHDGQIVIDSMEIVRYLESQFFQRPFYPADPARRSEMLIFIDWFNRVWKRPPNLINDEMQMPHPDTTKCAAWAAEMAGFLPLFDGLLQDRPYLFGETFSAADVCAFPFLKYAVSLPPDDPYLFHKILNQHQPIGPFPAIAAWIHRLDQLPRA